MPPDFPRTSLSPVSATYSWSDDEHDHRSDGDRPRTQSRALRRGVRLPPRARPRGGPLHRRRARRVRSPGPHRARPPHGRLAHHGPRPRQGPGEDSRLPVRRVPPGPSAGQRPAGHRPDRHRSRGPLRPRPRPGCHRRARGRAGPGQRRPGPSGRLLRRLAGDPRAAGHRVRHLLRVRHLRAVLRGRPTGGEARPVARPRQPVDVQPARARGLGRLQRSRRDRSRHRGPHVAPGRAGHGRSLQPARPRLRQQRGQHAAAVEGARVLAVQPRGVQRR